MFCFQKNKKEIPERNTRTAKIPPRPIEDVSVITPPHVSIVESLRSSVYFEDVEELFLGAFGIAQ